MANPNQLIVDTRCGKTFKASRRTFAHLDYTIARLAKLHPAARLIIIQGCYNDGVPASAGTHDFDAVLDVQIAGMDWWAGQWFLRTCGWAAWFRFPPTFSEHIHMVSLGYTTRVGIYVPGQVDDYYRHALGLKGQHDSGDDRSPFPPSIDDTLFDFALWEREMEDNMPYLNWPEDDRKALATDVAKAVGALVIDGAKLTLVQAVRQASNTPGLVRQLARGLKIPIGDK